MTGVLIAGGGPAGLAAAIALAERGVPVTVADPGGGMAAPRGELLAHGAQAIMHRLGLGPALHAAHVVQDIQSHWGAAGLQSHGVMPGLGWHGWGVDRRVLSEAMVARAAALGVTVLEARVTGAERCGAGWLVRVSTAGGHDSVSTRFVIDATGRAAAMARRHGAEALHGPDLLAAIWPVPGIDSQTMQAEAAPDGWWYSVPMTTGVSVGFVGAPAAVKAASASPAAFLAQADARLARTASAAPYPRLMDCRSAILDQTCGSGWLATGDAACAFDPISSQGLFNALSSGFFAGQAAADALGGDEDAPLVFEALLQRTAEHTHARTHLQYAALPFDTPFWHGQARGGPNQVAHRAEMRVS